jgi:hypothetical protein
MLPVSLNCPFLFALSVFSNVYFLLVYEEIIFSNILKYNYMTCNIVFLIKKKLTHDEWNQHRVHKTMKNKTKTIQRNWQHRVHKTMKNKTKTIQRNWQHRVHKTMKNKTKTIQRNWQHAMFCETPYTCAS